MALRKDERLFGDAALNTVGLGEMEKRGEEGRERERERERERRGLSIHFHA